ncbi:DUF262 domain-containing protein [Cronobacter sakazakii]|nr:DUF262 domain-containing protein [Cronobacter sakazakii]EGT5749922.1 DUF262 domain-containing protein [Cronobacter sakazakii]EJC1155793.1 DUF262 domain-containing protein [Cronobacter sakazakii]EJC1184377.1 DUF262 domain-containing protein [Cronobacter sakazakii]EJC1244510.1 DUF262 domain-containing protein [Cronobacter sakazakii]
MAGQYEKAITIKQAIDSINLRHYLLPAIQRKFVWSSSQICLLFDSIMRDYPINSFMMWDIRSASIKNDYKFYEFLKEYCQRFNEENPCVATNAGFHDFKAVIDGQQRLTSLYIGLCGTYAYKKPRVWWPSAQDDRILPPRKLYVDLTAPLKSDDELMMKYNFRFLTEKQYTDSLTDNKHHWFCLHEIFKYEQHDSPDDILFNVVVPELEKRGLISSEFSRKTLLKLYTKIRTENLIHYFNESSQDIDHVLDVFIRTNSGGTKLEFSDLLMSIAVAHWQGDFRRELDELTKNIYQNNEMGFYIERDWFLKTSLMLIDSDVRFKVKNFTSEEVGKIQQQWSEIKSCIKETFILIRRFGINPQSLISKNAVIPVAYWLYKKQTSGHPLYTTINLLNKNHNERSVISQWFYMVLLKGIFGSQADALLTSIRDIMKNSLSDIHFPLEKIIDRYKGSNKDLRFDDEYIESLLNIRYGEGRCRALLHLLFPEMNPTEVFHIDHLHPRNHFSKKYLERLDYVANSPENLSFYENPEHWDTIPNLHLLNHSQNISKQDTSLKQWLSQSSNNYSPSMLLVSDENIEFSRFLDFYNERRSALKQRLLNRVFLTTKIDSSPSTMDTDEEILTD